MDKDNIILPFSLYDADVKGRVIRLGSEVDIILKQHAYPDEVARSLASLLMVAALLGSQFKSEVILTVQLQTEGRIKYIVVDYQAPGHIRGYAQFDEEKEISNEALLNITVDHDGHRYQGIVEVNNMNISEAVEKYFAQSEQINTSIKLSVWNISGSWEAAGIMIQKLPSEGEDDETWETAKAYFATIRDTELMDPNLSLEKLLYLVYHEAHPRIYDYLPIIHKCRCSHSRAAQIIKSLGYKEAKSLLIDGKISVECQFCNLAQEFDKDELKQIYND